nr:8047_t:CDS:2 [Entrophospora candida]
MDTGVPTSYAISKVTDTGVPTSYKNLKSHRHNVHKQHPSRSNLQENLPPKPPTQKHNLPPPISPQQFNFLSFGNNQGSSDVEKNSKCLNYIIDNSDSSDDSTTDNSDVLADNLIDLSVNEDTEWIYPEQQKLDNRAFVGNLLHTIPKSRLESTLEEQFGSVVEIDCIYNKRCAFVTFANKTSYDTAIDRGFFFIEGIKLSICMAKTKKRNPSFIKKAE